MVSKGSADVNLHGLDDAGQCTSYVRAEHGRTLCICAAYRFVDSSRFQGALLDPNDLTCSAIDGRRFLSSDGRVGCPPNPESVHTPALAETHLRTLGASTRGVATCMTIG